VALSAVDVVNGIRQHPTDSAVDAALQDGHHVAMRSPMEAFP
jgi:hypothetical protein